MTASTGEDRPPPVGGVLETCLYSRNLDESASFYENVLRLVPFSRVPGRHVFFHAGAGVFLLFNPDRTALGGEVPPHGATGAGHVAFAVPADELPAWRRWLGESGVEVESQVTWPAGGMSLYVRDPAGNSVELASPKIWSMEEE